MSQDKSSRTNRCGQNVAWTKCRRTIRCRTNGRGHNVADKMLRTKRRKKFVAWTKRRTDKMSHGQNVARTKCRMDKMLQ
jgi:hypothetical protein